MRESKSTSFAAFTVILCILVIQESSTAPVKTQEDAWKFLLKYQYAPDPSSAVSADFQDGNTAFKQYLKEMQLWAGLNQTGELNDETLEMMNKPRCAVLDKLGVGSGARRRRRYVAEGSKWRRNALTYGFTKYTQQMDQATQTNILTKALNMWSKVTPLTFTQTSSSNNDIQILFASGAHGDSSPFDGPLGVLAHAYFPSSGGDAHFDNDETWTDGQYRGTNLFQVSTHEFGHSLGLGHSTDPSAVMFAYYNGYNPNFQLTNDDISGIQYLYGAPTAGSGQTTTTPTTTTTTQTTTTPAPGSSRTSGGLQTTPRLPVAPTSSRLTICNNPTVDAIVVVDGVTYAFSGYDYYVLNDNGVETGYPQRISTRWPQISGPIDAALYYDPVTSWDSYGRPILVRPGILYLFKGSQFWKYQNVNQLEVGYPRNIRDGFPGIPDNIDTAFIWSGNGRIFFVKGNSYYRYSPGIGTDAGYPKPFSAWTGIPQGISAAFQWKNRRTYFFKDTQYYRFDDVNFRAESGFPRNTGEWWFGCGASSGNLESGVQNSESQNEPNNFIQVENSNTNSGVKFYSVNSLFLVAVAAVVKLLSNYL